MSALSKTLLAFSLVALLARPVASESVGTLRPTLSIVPLASVSTEGELVLIGVRIANQTSAPLVVPRPYLAGTVRLLVEQADGASVPNLGVIKDIAHGRDVESMLIAPGISTTMLVALAAHFPMPAGTYSVRAEFSALPDRTARDPGMPHVVPWEGKVASEPVTIVVTAAEDPADVDARSLAVGRTGLIARASEVWLRHPKTAAGQSIVAGWAGRSLPLEALGKFEKIDRPSLLPRYRCVVASDMARAMARLGHRSEAVALLAEAGDCEIMADFRAEARRLLDLPPGK